MVDQYVDDLAHTFGVQRASLNVVSRRSSCSLIFIYSDFPFLKVAAAKGLVAGSLLMTRADGCVVDGSSASEVSNQIPRGAS